MHIMPMYEQACPVCDPTQKAVINQLENVQNNTVQYVLGQQDPTQAARP